MTLQSLQITATVAMRARDVSRPTREQQEAADRRPLRDETSHREQRASPSQVGRAGIPQAGERDPLTGPITKPAHRPDRRGGG